jgi:hypothetical protein
MPIPKAILQDIIKLRHMSGEEIREYFQKRADFHSIAYPRQSRNLWHELQKIGLLIKRSGTD